MVYSCEMADGIHDFEKIEITLTKAQKAALEREAEATGRSVESLLAEYVGGRLDSLPTDDDWKEKLLALAVIWKDRPNIHEEIRANRGELNKRLGRLFSRSGNDD